MKRENLDTVMDKDHVKTQGEECHLLKRGLGQVLPSQPSEETNRDTPILDFQTPEWGDRKCLLFKPLKLVVLCDGSLANASVPTHDTGDDCPQETALGPCTNDA